MDNLNRMLVDIDDMFEDVWSEGLVEGLPKVIEREFQPACSVKETPLHFVVGFDLPGVNREDILIELEENCLRVRGELKEDHAGGHLHGIFDRLIPLPSNLDLNAVEAHFENGFLHVDLPKTEVPVSHNDWRAA